VFGIAKALSEHLGKTVCISLDRPGFIVNRILMPMVNEAFYTLMEVCACVTWDPENVAPL
jgi:3-hydroxybutyryl-CoA dehydrogenase